MCSFFFEAHSESTVRKYWPLYPELKLFGELASFKKSSFHAFWLGWLDNFLETGIEVVNLSITWL